MGIKVKKTRIGENKYINVAMIKKGKLSVRYFIMTKMVKPIVMLYETLIRNFK